MFRAHRPIFWRVRTAVHTTIGSVFVPLCSRALYVVACLGDYSLLPVGPKHVEIQQYTNKIVTSVGFHSIYRDMIRLFMVFFERHANIT